MSAGAVGGLAGVALARLWCVGGIGRQAVWRDVSAGAGGIGGWLAGRLGRLAWPRGLGGGVRRV